MGGSFEKRMCADIITAAGRVWQLYLCAAENFP